MGHAIALIARQFQLAGEYQSATPFGSGHINDTYCVVVQSPRGPVRYILQRINHHVFPNPLAVMENVARVTRHLRGKLIGHPDIARRVLTLVPARDGAEHYRDTDGNVWRVYQFIAGARTYDAVESPAQAYQAARAFGRFQQLLADLPPPRLHETIPDFHNTPRRFAVLVRASQVDAVNRAARCRPEIAFAEQRHSLTGLLLDAGLPERVTHNDTKFNNVMLDDATGEGLCVVDLDTVMPGLALYDFGDQVRTTTSPTLEDERDLTKIELRLPMYAALVRGYLETAGELLTPAEKRLLVAAGKLITFEIGIRFLTDFLAGDIYYKVHRADHNLDRCRTQFQLVRLIEQQEDALQRLVDSV